MLIIVSYHRFLAHFLNGFNIIVLGFHNIQWFHNMLISFLDTYTKHLGHEVLRVISGSHIKKFRLLHINFISGPSTKDQLIEWFKKASEKTISLIATPKYKDSLAANRQ